MIESFRETAIENAASFVLWGGLLIGAVFGHWVMDYPLTMMSMIGLVALTGIVVNEVAGLPRRDLRTFRAAVHRVTRDGFKDVHERQRMLGYASYVRMVKPALGERWLEALREVRS